MNLLSRAAACCLLALSLTACALDVSPAVAPGSFIGDLWAEMRPQAITAIAGIGLGLLSILGAWVAARAASALKAIKEEKLALSLYRTMETGLKVIFARKLDAGLLPAAIVQGTVVSEALEFTKANNPESVAGLKQSDGALIDKIVARIPEAKAAVVEAAAKAQSTAQ